MAGLKKVIRHIRIYGLLRVLAKVASRKNIAIPFKLLNVFKSNSLGLNVKFIGLGHHAYSSLAYHVALYSRARFSKGFDISEERIKLFSNAFGSSSENYSLCYIASNHSTHAKYALEEIRKGKSIYVEKPLAVNLDELHSIKEAIKLNPSVNLWLGYNRPFSKAIGRISKILTEEDDTAFTYSAFVRGHFIGEDHWYRNDKEGSRIISNVGHWIDLFVYLLFLVNETSPILDITIVKASQKQTGENITLSMSTGKGHLANLTFVSRNEPLNGVEEKIEIQTSNYNFSIDDFRTMSESTPSKVKTFSYFPKDNGHKSSALQPFQQKVKRSPDELFFSTELMLFIEDMAKSNVSIKRFTSL